MNFIVYAPSWTYRSGGTRALHNLCHRLNVMGENAYVHPASVVDLRLQTPPLGPRGTDWISDPICCVYPEVVRGNPFNADLSVRWLLNAPGRANADTTDSWGADDLIFHWAASFKRGESELLSLPVIDKAIFNNKDNEADRHRHGSFVYSQKAFTAGEPVPTNLGLNLADYIIQPEMLAQLLRCTKTLYLCEESMIALEADLCGCRVEYVESDFLPRPPGPWIEHSDLEARQMVQNMIDACYRRKDGNLA